MKLRVGGLTLLAICGVLTPACGGQDEPARYVGSVRGSDAFVGIVVDGERVVAYVCDGVRGRGEPSVQAWFSGRSDGKRLDVAGASGGRIQAQVNGSAMTGTITLADGRSLPYTASRVTGNAGLYRGETIGASPRAVAGWIVAADGRQRGGVTGISRTSRVLTFRLAIPLADSPPAIVSKNTQGLVPSPLTAEDFDSVSKD